MGGPLTQLKLGIQKIIAAPTIPTPIAPVASKSTMLIASFTGAAARFERK